MNNYKDFLKFELRTRGVTFGTRDNQWQLAKLLIGSKIENLCDELDLQSCNDQDATNFPSVLQKLINDYIGYDHYDHSIYNPGIIYTSDADIFINPRLYTLFNDYCRPECYMKVKTKIQNMKNSMKKGYYVNLHGGIENCRVLDEHSVTFKYKTWSFEALCNILVRVNFTSQKYRMKHKPHYQIVVKHIYNSDDHSYYNKIMKGGHPSHLKIVLRWEIYMKIDTDLLLHRIINSTGKKRHFLIERLKNRIISHSKSML